ncbi:hypothetical protein Airi01_020900 [Actinoallomurus iriomotensis]|uniref:Uncharacterized protein n=2 Tax=Actinoallomurus iriomotensis TaxID=478107 RepID=A0A9W6VJ97_9ACTN|nr:hypothetical protein Airi01_020900 [Actinoallomurus iriomotensis]
MAFSHFGLNVNAVLTFWIAYILTRPFGASSGDHLSQARSDGGLGPTNRARRYLATARLLRGSSKPVACRRLSSLLPGSPYVGPTNREEPENAQVIMASPRRGAMIEQEVVHDGASPAARETSPEHDRRSRAVWWCLWTWTAIWTGLRLPGGGGSWHYFAQGSRLLFGDDPGQGLHLYAAHPDLQIGPIAFLVATPLRLLGATPGRLLALTAMSLTGPLVLYALWRLAPAGTRQPSRLLTTGLLFLPVWAELVTHAGHLDDVLALLFAVAALHAVRSGHPVAAGLLVAASADAKPWAAAFAPLVLAVARPDRWRAAAACAAGVAVAWLPFLLYDGHTLTAASFAIPTATSSGLRALGFTYPRTPSWDRPAQLALGCLLGTLAVIRGRWPAVIVLATAARILLDPEVYSYYTAGILLGAVAYDLVASDRRWPWLTTGGLLMLHVARLVAHVAPISLHVLGLLRVGYVLVVVAVTLLPGSRRPMSGHDAGAAHACG